MHTHYKAKIKKITWLQVCYILGDVRVIWCNSLSDSHSQNYVMNNVEIVIDYYLYITSHVSHDVTSCTHFTSYYLLNLVHEIVCEIGLAIQGYMFFDFDTKYVYWLKFGDKLCHNLVFGSSGLKASVFEKLLNSYSCISFMKSIGLSVLCIKILLFFKNSIFPKFRSIECVFRLIENSLNFLNFVLLGLIDPWLALDQSNLFFFWLIEPSSWLIENFKVFIEKFLLVSIGARQIEFRMKRKKGPFPHMFFTFPKF